MKSVESKNFEIAVIRMVGLHKVGVMSLIIFQSFLYVIPAIILSFFSSIILLDQAGQTFQE